MDINKLYKVSIFMSVVVLSIILILAWPHSAQPDRSCDDATQRLSQSWTEISMYQQRITIDPSSKSSADYQALLSAKDLAVADRAMACR